MNAPKFSWLQSFSTIKQKIHSIINGALSTETLQIHLFDSSFSNIGSTTRPRVRSETDLSGGYKMVRNKKTCLDDNWQVSDIVNEIVFCKKCGKRGLNTVPECCAQL